MARREARVMMLVSYIKRIQKVSYDLKKCQKILII